MDEESDSTGSSSSKSSLSESDNDLIWKKLQIMYLNLIILHTQSIYLQFNHTNKSVNIIFILTI